MKKDIKEMEAIERVVGALEMSKDKDEYTLMEHLSEMMHRIMVNPKEYPLEKIEELSYLVKLARLKVKQPLTDSEIKAMTHKTSEKQEWTNKYSANLLKVSNG